MQVVLSVTVMLVDLSVAIMHVNVSVAIIQLEVSAALMQVTVSDSNMWVTISIVFMQVGEKGGVEKGGMNPLTNYDLNSQIVVKL